MDVVLVGLPGSGKSAVGRRLASRHGARFVDLDETIETTAGRRIADIFATEGEPGFRARERSAVADLGPADARPEVRFVIATGGGAVVDPRNRWWLYRGRTVVWLDGLPEALAQRLRHSPNPRPLIAGPDPIGAIRALAAARERFYAAGHRVNGLAPVGTVVETIEALLTEPRPTGTTLLDATTPIGRMVIGDELLGRGLVEQLLRLGARRALIVSEPGAWAAVGPRISASLDAAGLPLELTIFPTGEEAKKLAQIEIAARALTGLRVERGEPLVAVGGGALGDSAGFLAAVYLRGIPLIHVPTTLVAQLDSSIGGKTAVDLPEGKNLVGAFHQPSAVIADVATLRTLPDRQRRAALGEAVKMAALGDDRLFELLETDGEAIARGTDAAFDGGAVAELVERAAWAKVEVVLADERERGGPPDADGTAAAGRLALNLGHSMGHALEAAAGYEGLLHGEAVAYGLRAACRIGLQTGVTPAARAARIAALLDRLGLGVGRLGYPTAAVLERLASDKKTAGGRLRWVLPTADGVVVRSDVPDSAVAAALGELLGPASAGAAAERGALADSEAAAR
ncbi:MAG: shikimate kinase / 3-dehydroquinate synthase [Chloroflexota bacterium]|nr:shikimate kinase / 3-dehydroquinate synthase [Chloroflexota bacterium]